MMGDRQTDRQTDRGQDMTSRRVIVVEGWQARSWLVRGCDVTDSLIQHARHWVVCVKGEMKHTQTHNTSPTHVTTTELLTVYVCCRLWRSSTWNLCLVWNTRFTRQRTLDRVDIMIGIYWLPLCVHSGSFSYRLPLFCCGKLKQQLLLVYSYFF